MKQRNAFQENRITERQSTVFGLVMLLERRWSALGDRELAADKLTTKQWAMLATLAKGFSSPPSLGEVAHKLSSSHQNARAIAAQLEKRGFLRLEKDAYDGRVLRLVLTSAFEDFAHKHSAQDQSFMQQLMQGFAEDELEQLALRLNRLRAHAEDLLQAQSRKDPKATHPKN